MVLHFAVFRLCIGAIFKQKPDERSTHPLFVSTYLWWGVGLEPIPEDTELPMPHILPTSANETIGEETEGHCPVFYNAFARSTQSAEMLRYCAAHRLEDTICCLSIIVPLSYFSLLLVESRRIFFLDHFNILCL